MNAYRGCLQSKTKNDAFVVSSQGVQCKERERECLRVSVIQSSVPPARPVGELSGAGSRSVCAVNNSVRSGERVRCEQTGIPVGGRPLWPDVVCYQTTVPAHYGPGTCADTHETEISSYQICYVTSLCWFVRCETARLVVIM